MHQIYYILILYLIFFALTYSYFNIEEKKISKQNTEAYVLLAIAFVFRLLVSTYLEGHTTDIHCFKSWSLRLADVGPSNFYSPDYFADYPPGYMLILYIIGTASKIFGFEASSDIFTMLVKLPSIIADILLGLIIYRHTKQAQTKKSAITLMILVIFGPPIVINSTFWGQIDSFFTLFLVLSLISVYKEKYYMGAFLYTICALIKPQAFIFAPVYLCAYFSVNNWKMIGKSLLVSLATVFIVSLPFSLDLNFMWLIEKYSATLKSYPYATVNAYNFYALLGYNWKELSSKLIMLPVSALSNLVIAGVTAGSIWFYFKSQNKAKIFYMAYLIIAVLFTFGGKMHERYLLPALLLIVMTYIYNKDIRLLFLFIAQSSAHYLNVGDVLISNTSGREIHTGIVIIAALLHIICVVYSLYLAREIFLPCKKKQKTAVIEVNENLKNVKKDYIIMAAITFAYGVTAFASLGDTKAPQTFHLTASDVVLDMGETKEIGSVMMYLGIGKGNYVLETSTDNTNWTEYAQQEHDHRSVFVWRRVGGETQAQYLKITADKNNLMIGEIGIMGKDGNMIDILSSEAPELTDEQETVPLKPSYMNGTYFDEIYHPRTAYEILYKLPPFEITHPPLGKLIMSVGIMLLGMTPFGWRFTGTLAGVIMVPIFYLMCKKLVRQTDIAAIGTILFAFDFMHFAQTRLATIDSFAVLFIMLMFYFAFDYFTIDFNKEPLRKGLVSLALCGTAFGIGAAIKWNCIYSSFGLAVIILSVWIKAYFSRNSSYKDKMIKTVLWCILFFIIIPSAIYFVSYLPQIRYDLNGRTTLEYVFQNQRYMLNYHKGVTETHPYSSQWYEWLINKRPLWAYIDSELRHDGIVSSISSFGNPLVWWSGLVGILGCIYLWITRKNKAVIFIIIAYLSQLLPWIAVPRVVFIYHYFPCVPFIVLAIACCLKYLNEVRGFKMREIYGFCTASVLLFVMFYPIISGMGVGEWYVANILKWFDTWTFF